MLFLDGAWAGKRECNAYAWKGTRTQQEPNRNWKLSAVELLASTRGPFWFRGSRCERQPCSLPAPQYPLSGAIETLSGSFLGCPKQQSLWVRPGGVGQSMGGRGRQESCRWGCTHPSTQSRPQGREHLFCAELRLWTLWLSLHGCISNGNWKKAAASAAVLLSTCPSFRCWTNARERICESTHLCRLVGEIHAYSTAFLVFCLLESGSKNWRRAAKGASPVRRGL